MSSLIPSVKEIQHSCEISMGSIREKHNKVMKRADKSIAKANETVRQFKAYQSSKIDTIETYKKEYSSELLREEKKFRWCIPMCESLGNCIKSIWKCIKVFLCIDYCTGKKIHGKHSASRASSSRK